MKSFFSFHISNLGGLITFSVLNIAMFSIPAVAESNTTYIDSSSLAQAPPSSALNEARRRARILRGDYPGWKDALDACPCTQREAEANPRFTDATNRLTRVYHPGAVWDYRTSENAVGTYNSPTLPPGSQTLRPGQQCTYGTDGLLITGGSGAGTPDAYSPAITWPGQGLVSDNSHTFWDVTPANSGMSWREYNQTWTPNNTNGCPTNFVTVYKTNSTVITDLTFNPESEYRIRIRASGIVVFGTFAGQGIPTGLIRDSSNQRMRSYNHFRDFRHGLLMARYRQPGMQALDGWFPLGVGWDDLREPASGVLEFLVNDKEPDNNGGEFSIEVTIRSSQQ